MMSKPMADVTIVAARREDAADIQAIYAPFVQETSVSFETVPPSVETIADRISGNLDSHGYF
ncbi:MAG: N-acetyltransferase, partial [Planktomarina sp.]|nr:N-acetyltransferase [Planktomarina sp.]